MSQAMACGGGVRAASVDRIPAERKPNGLPPYFVPVICLDRLRCVPEELLFGTSLHVLSEPGGDHLVSILTGRRVQRRRPMTYSAVMTREAAQCFRWACEAETSEDKRLLLNLRQAWLALASDAERVRRGRKHRLAASVRTTRRTEPQAARPALRAAAPGARAAGHHGRARPKQVREAS